MQFLRRLTLIDYALFLALIVAGALAVVNQRTGVAAEGTGAPISSQNIASFQAARDSLFDALATGAPAEGPFEALAAAARNAGEPAVAGAVVDLGAAYAMRSDTGVAAALRTLNGLAATSRLAAPVVEAFASGTLRYGLDAGPATPASGREWVHLVWFETDIDAFDGWEIVTGEATWTAEPGNAAIDLSFTVANQAYSGTLRLAPASPGALVEATATFSSPLDQIVIAVGEGIPEDNGILVLDLGDRADGPSGQPWRGETRLGEPADLIAQIQAARGFGWLASLPDGRNFFMRIKVGETGRAAIASVFPT